MSTRYKVEVVLKNRTANKHTGKSRQYIIVVLTIVLNYKIIF